METRHAVCAKICAPIGPEHAERLDTSRRHAREDGCSTRRDLRCPGRGGLSRQAAATQRDRRRASLFDHGRQHYPGRHSGFAGQLRAQQAHRSHFPGSTESARTRPQTPLGTLAWARSSTLAGDSFFCRRHRRRQARALRDCRPTDACFLPVPGQSGSHPASCVTLGLVLCLPLSFGRHRSIQIWSQEFLPSRSRFG